MAYRDKYFNFTEEFLSRKDNLTLKEKVIDFLEENIWWNVERLWEWPQDKYRAIKWFIQRGRRGYADCDLWSLDWYLLSWLPKAIRELKTISYGHPIGIKSHKEWKKILTRMADGLEAGYTLVDLGYNIRQKDRRLKLEKQFNEGMGLFVKYFVNLWD